MWQSLVVFDSRGQNFGEKVSHLTYLLLNYKIVCARDCPQIHYAANKRMGMERALVASLASASRPTKLGCMRTPTAYTSWLFVTCMHFIVYSRALIGKTFLPASLKWANWLRGRFRHSPVLPYLSSNLYPFLHASVKANNERFRVHLRCMCAFLLKAKDKTYSLMIRKNGRFMVTLDR